MDKKRYSYDDSGLKNHIRQRNHLYRAIIGGVFHIVLCVVLYFVFT